MPHCFIRVDVAHVLKLVTQWQCLKGKSRRIKEFYIRSVGQLILSTSLNQARNIVRAILVVSMSETEGKSARTGQDTASESSKNWLKTIIASSLTDLDCEPYLMVDDQTSISTDHEEKPQEDQTDRKNEFSKWAKGVFEECKLTVESDGGDRDNLHYIPELHSSLIAMCDKLPLWTGIMVPIFGYGAKVASSTSVESYFKELKINLLGRGEYPRVDNFLMNHIKLNDGSLKIAGSTDMYDDINQASNEEILGTDDLILTLQEVELVEPVKRGCIACSNGNKPEGAHKCVTCHKSVHALEGCSVPVGEEGYGQKRKCTSCAEFF